MNIILLAVSLLASTIGAIVGFGGGVIIKPVLDAIGILPVSTISFLSGCTVLAMSVSSIIRGRNDGINLDLRTSTALALGSVIGGILGKAAFNVVKDTYGNENVLGLIQAVILVMMTTAVLVYVIKRNKLKSYNVTGIHYCIFAGVALGVISSFLGIGGGPNNIALLFLMFSMDARTAAKTSLYIIIFSQNASLMMTILDGTVPIFSVASLAAMVTGGVAGAIAGAGISKRLNNKKMESVLRLCITIVIFINLYNCMRFGSSIVTT